MLIGLLGRKQVGKDTVADYIIKKYQYEKMSIAEPVKQICKTLFNFNTEQLYGNLKEEICPKWKVKPRHVLQYLCDIFRNDINKIMPDIKDNLFVEIFKENYLNKKNTNIIVCDIRFPNELETIHMLGGIIIKIIRPNIENNDLHNSESFVDKLVGDCEIINDASVDILYAKLDKLINAKFDI